MFLTGHRINKLSFRLVIYRDSIRPNPPKMHSPKATVNPARDMQNGYQYRQLLIYTCIGRGMYARHKKQSQ
jgi:hypothetical protein